ncbi:MAG TPA: Gfo/Idh/MocA family oxidoreductase [Acidimicrobiales bacterium]|nr:Gfo/Idh/MocA family oxidoreductase [Acidimicrobiales bacterium]
MSDPADLRVALVGYGLAGSVFHGPLVAATPGLALTTIVTGDPSRRARARLDFPGAAVVGSTDELWADAGAHDLVVVATTTGSHVDVATAAVDAGLAVVVEKPLAPRAEPGRTLVDRAAAAGVMLTVFHNRRWDAEFLTLRRLVGAGVLGDVVRFESRFERWRPDPSVGAWRHELPADDGGGVLLDLGIHLVDQALVLLGPATHVTGEVASRRGGADDDVFVALRHASGAISHLWASAVAAAPGPRLRVLGREAAYVVEHLDGQEDQLRAGRRPGDPGFGVEPPLRWGRLRRGDDGEPVPSEPGRWPAFYEGVAQALRGGGAPPVDPADAVRALQVLDAARRSAREASVVAL